MSNVADIRYEVMKIKKMVVEIYKIPVIVEPILETMIHTVHVPNIWAIPLDAPVEETEEQRREKKRKREEDGVAKKRARARSIQDKRDR